MSQEVTGVITGLTPGNSYTFDGSYDVEIVDTAGAAGYGGANTAGASGPGGFEFEIWETLNLLGSCLYDPAVAVTEATTALLAMTVMDTTNLRITFTAPGSGNVYWRIYVPFHGSTTIGQVLLGILESSTVRARVAPIMGCPFGAIAATSCVGLEASGVITGLTPGNSYTWDAAYGVETISGAGGLKYGGPNDTTTNNAFGAAAFEVWAA
jgi:hypothetical protein